MASTEVAEGSGVADARQLSDWVEQNWSDSITVGEWWSRLAARGYSSAMLPVGYGGLGASRDTAQRINVGLGSLGVLGPPLGVGLTLVAPTLLHFGSAEQIEAWVPDIAAGRQAWCQLFSEPGAGSDLASLECRAWIEGDTWLAEGRKIWTSGAELADMGLLLARTDPNVPRQRGITAFGVEMHQPRIRIEPLRQMTGRGGFTTVHLERAEITPLGPIGDLGAGWAVAKHMLEEERASYRAAGSGGLITAVPGTRSGSSQRRALDVVREGPIAARNVVAETEVERLIGIARDLGKDDDPVVRQEIVRLATLVRIARMIEQRAAFAGNANISKLIISDTFRKAIDVCGQIMGSALSVAGPDSTTDGWAQDLVTFAPAPAIYGGTDQIQRNILAERVLGLPRDSAT